MQVYRVGGSVRDELLGLPVVDRDWVVVGATPEEMVAAGYLPVGQDFPVFLHPQTREEYALARTERKSGRGHRGFRFHAAPDVTLEEDLRRRDLTVNAMARDESGRLIDPYGGGADLASRTLRHVSDAFAEDPLRVLRVARFAARLGFEVAPETQALMSRIAESGELGTLTPERVWQEIARGLMTDNPSRMLSVLRACRALSAVLPEVDALFGVPQPEVHHPEIDTGIHVLQALDYAAREGASLAVRYAVLTHDLGKGLTPSDVLPHHHGHEARSVELAQELSRRLKVPADCSDLAVLVAREHGKVHRALELRDATLLDLLRAADAWRRPWRLEGLLQACEADVLSRPGRTGPYLPELWLRGAAGAVAEVDAASIAAQIADKAQIPHRLRAAQLQALRAWREKQKAPD
jgi:tRNA nucleotidyltransferase (CCA-adding enzyme)